MLAEVTIALSPHRPVGAAGARGAHRAAGTGGAAGGWTPGSSAAVRGCFALQGRPTPAETPAGEKRVI